MKTFVIVKPKRTDTSDGNRSNYEYPSTEGLQVQVIAYNQTLSDFIKEQLWLIEGAEEQIAEFKKTYGVIKIESWDEAARLLAEWSPLVETMNDPVAVMTEVRNIVVHLKIADKLVPSVLDPTDPTPGIVMRKIKLSDYIKKEDMK